MTKRKNNKPLDKAEQVQQPALISVPAQWNLEPFSVDFFLTPMTAEKIERLKHYNKEHPGTGAWRKRQN